MAFLSFLFFKLHLVSNERCEVQAFTLTIFNVDDKKPVANLTKKLTGLLFGEKAT
jgi:hypothetical protein